MSSFRNSVPGLPVRLACQLANGIGGSIVRKYLHVVRAVCSELQLISEDEVRVVSALCWSAVSLTGHYWLQRFLLCHALCHLLCGASWTRARQRIGSSRLEARSAPMEYLLASSVQMQGDAVADDMERILQRRCQGAADWSKERSGVTETPAVASLPGHVIAGVSNERKHLQGSAGGSAAHKHKHSARARGCTIQLTILIRRKIHLPLAVTAPRHLSTQEPFHAWGLPAFDLQL